MVDHRSNPGPDLVVDVGAVSAVAAGLRAAGAEVLALAAATRLEAVAEAVPGGRTAPEAQHAAEACSAVVIGTGSALVGVASGLLAAAEQLAAVDRALAGGVPG